MIAMTALAFASCSNNENVFDPDAKTKEKDAKYQAVFEKEFGKVAKGVNWGFEDQEGYFDQEGKWYVWWIYSPGMYVDDVIFGWRVFQHCGCIAF